MLKFLLKRLLQTLPTLLALMILSFLMIRILPGDPVLSLLGERGATPEAYLEMQKALGLDQSFVSQFLNYSSQLFRGDFGTSIFTKAPVVKEFFTQLPATVELSFLALLLAISFGIPLGLFSAYKKNTFWDPLLSGVSLLGYSMPIFWWALILILFFSVQLGWTPVSGRIHFIYEIPQVTGFYLIDSWWSANPFAAFWSSVQHLILPAFVLGTIPLASIARFTRSAMLESLGQDYIRTAHSKGLGVISVLFKHALRNASIPIVTAIGLMTGALLTGAVLTESIFSWPGLGRWLVQALLARDYPVIQGGILLIAILIVAVNIFVDLLYYKINPTLKSIESEAH